jgi:hypothetical protein
MRWPLGVEMSPRSSSNCMTIAVEVSTKPAPATNETETGKPVASPTPVRSRAQIPTWSTPSPKISRRKPQSREGSISRPMMNRNITTPSSAT